jgi:methionyl-tRNA formyltransferase
MNKTAIIITGNQSRHKYFISQILNHFDVLCIISETKFDYIKEFNDKVDGEIIKEHFDSRSISENKYFSNIPLPKNTWELEKGEVNSDEIIDRLGHMNADFILLFGSSIIKPRLLNIYSSKVINLHLGLSPYYRGSGTNFWPLVDNKPQCVGATIHLATSKVDAGGILAQCRPEELNVDDNCHDLGNKTIKTAIRILPFVLKSYFNKDLIPSEQVISRNLEYKRLDLKPENILKMNANFENGLMKNYLQNKMMIDSEYPIKKFKL